MKILIASKQVLFFFQGLYPLVGWKIGGETVYLAEGNAAGCGTAMEWARQMGKNLNLNV